jgi:hypothetical protein
MRVLGLTSHGWQGWWQFEGQLMGLTDFLWTTSATRGGFPRKLGALLASTPS